MGISFKKWFLSEEKAIGSDGKNSHPTASAQAAEKVTQGFLGQPQHADQVSRIVRTGTGSTKTDQLVKLGAEAISKSPQTIAGKTDATQVANFMSKSISSFKKMKKK